MTSSTERIHRSTYFPHETGIDLFYSYTTCDPSFDDWTRVEQKHTLGGVTILATVPGAYFPPYTYKRDFNGEILTDAGDEYYDDSVPFEGVLIDYLSRLQKLSGGDFNITYVHGSRASKLVHPTSAYTAAVQDIEDGLIDLSVGPFWITGERLQMTPFTVPLFQSRTVLVIPKPGADNSLGAQISKVLEPFTLGAWALILGIIIVASLFSVWFSDRSRLAQKYSRRRNYRNAAPQPSQKQNKGILARLTLDAFLEKGIFFCSAGIEQDIRASLPYKILMFGFGFFILIVCAAYVANLAAFLTRQYPEYVGTMDEAVAKGMSICVLPAIKTEVEIAHPRAQFVHTGGKGTYGLIDDYDAKKCDFVAVGFTSIELTNMLCHRDLVLTDSLITENHVALPLRQALRVCLTGSTWPRSITNSLSLPC